ncbi:MAG: polyketide synthase dehydratase domain-containing protein, partial [Lentisphaerae bacterium]|nr:polyketide synthase dehydratase domain-containing protein [Lentisphaerota bacterium]
VFVEIGPRGNLTAFTDDILKDRPHAAVPLNRINRPGLVQLQRALGMLAAHGVPLDPAYLFAGRGRARRREKPAGAGAGRALSFEAVMPRFALAGLADRVGADTLTETPSRPAQPAGAAAATAAVSAYLGTMQQFLEAQRAVMGGYLADGQPETAGGSEPQPRGGPLAGRVLACREGERAEVLSTVDIAKTPLVADHAIGTSRVSALDPDLRGFPVMALPTTLELAAEAAALPVPGRSVIGFRDVRAHHWIGFERGRRVLRARAAVLETGEPAAVRVEIRSADIAGDPADDDVLLAEATVLLAARYPAPERPDAPELEGERPCGWSGRDIYPLRLFHGPRLQTLRNITRWGENGLRGTLEIMPRGDLLEGVPRTGLLTDPITLDGLSQALGVWGACTPLNGRVLFPVSAREIRFYGPPGEPGEILELALHVTEAAAGHVRADIAGLDAAGRPRLDVRGWTDGVFDVTAPLHAATQMPLERYLSLPGPAPGRPGAVPDAAARFLLTGAPVWLNVLRFVVLNRRERGRWDTLPDDRAARVRWLLERTAAKDALRRALAERDGTHLAAADVTVRERPGGGLAAAVYDVDKTG